MPDHVVIEKDPVADEHVDVVELWQSVQNLHEVGGAELSRSTGGFDRLRQPDRFFLAYHSLSL
jgi:hypothetical protein